YLVFAGSSNSRRCGKEAWRTTTDQCRKKQRSSHFQEESPVSRTLCTCSMIALFVFSGTLQADTLTGDVDIDKHALAATTADEATLVKLAKYLVGPCKSDRDKAHAIYRWITDRIAYNAEGLSSGNLGDNTPASVLKNRKAVCEGYAALY